MFSRAMLCIIEGIPLSIGFQVLPPEIQKEGVSVRRSRDRIGDLPRSQRPDRSEGAGDERPAPGIGPTYFPVLARTDAKDLSSRTREAQERAASAEEVRDEAHSAFDAIAAKLSALGKEVSGQKDLVSKLQQAVDKGRAEIGDRLIDQDFFGRSHREMHLTAPGSRIPFSGNAKSSSWPLWRFRKRSSTCRLRRCCIT
jgi:hypothetical protein